MKAFTTRVNATLPVDKPDHILLALVQGHQGVACAPKPVLAKAPAKPEPPEADAAQKPTPAIVPPIVAVAPKLLPPPNSVAARGAEGGAKPAGADPCEPRARGTPGAGTVGAQHLLESVRCAACATADRCRRSASTSAVRAVPRAPTGRSGTRVP